jgi:hypothetical protein
VKIIPAIIAAAVASAIGAVVWVLIRNYTGYELGLVAWGIGVLAGIGAAVATAGKSDGATGFAAACVAVLTIAGAKYTFATMIHDELTADVEMVSLTEENMIAMHADDVVLEREAEGKRIVWPDGYDYETAFEQEHYPEDIWKEAEAEWYAMPEADREQMMDLLDFELKEFFPSPIEILKADLSPFDALWVVLAFASAFKIGSGVIGEA